MAIEYKNHGVKLNRMLENGFIYKKTLIIDDSEMDLLVNQMIIKTANLSKETITKNNGKEGWLYLSNLLKEKPEELPDLILLDINMPEMNGFEFLSKFEQEAALTKYCKVIVISSSEDMEDLQKASQFKCVANYVVKPLEIASIKKLV